MHNTASEQQLSNSFGEDAQCARLFKVPNCLWSNKIYELISAMKVVIVDGISACG